MHLADVYCRCCGMAFNLEFGCEICNPARKNLVKPDQLSSFHKTNSGSLLNQTLRILTLSADRLENEMHRGMHEDDTGSKINPASSRYYREHGREAMSLAKSAAALIDAARKYEKQEAENVDAMSLEQKLELVLTMLEDFPPDLILQASQRMQKLIEAPTEAQFE